MTGGDTFKPSSGASQDGSQGDDTDSPFGVWLSRGLHQLFDDVANEPIPDELLKLIQDHRDSNK